MSYLAKTKASIAKQCSRRGIVETDMIAEVEAFFRQRFDKKLDEMSERQLREVNQELPRIMLAYLEGMKRRPPIAKPKG